MKKILAILPSQILYGKERSNIEVYHLIKNKGIADLHVIINKDANINLKNELIPFEHTEIRYPNRHHKRNRLLNYIIDLFKGNLQMYKIIKKENPSLIFMNTETSFYDFAFIFFLIKIPILYRVGDAPVFERLSAKKLNRFLWQKLIKKKVHTVVSISSYIKKEMSNAGRKSKNDTVIYNYPPQRESALLRESEIDRYPIESANGLTIGYIGQIIEKKGVNLLIESFIQQLKKGRDLTLLVAGSLEKDTQFATMIRMKIPEEFKSRIIFLGEIKNIKIFFGKIDVLCVPSVKEEPLGNVLVEAKKYSRPIIIFPSGGMPELITHQKDGYICKEKTAVAISEAIDFFIEHSDKLNEFNQASHLSIEELKIGRVFFEKQWISVFNNILK